jgi:hypothetical protein
MPLDVRGCTRATLKGSTRVASRPGTAGEPVETPSAPRRDWDRGLQLCPLNEEFPVSAGHQLVLITSLPFVHTARRYYRVLYLVRCWDRRGGRLRGRLPRLGTPSNLMKSRK